MKTLIVYKHPESGKFLRALAPGQQENGGVPSWQSYGAPMVRYHSPYDEKASSMSLTTGRIGRERLIHNPARLQIGGYFVTRKSDVKEIHLIQEQDAAEIDALDQKIADTMKSLMAERAALVEQAYKRGVSVSLEWAKEQQEAK